MEISNKDKLIMHSMYKSNKNFTYEDIAKAYERQYPGLQSSMVGRIVRERENKLEAYVPIEEERALKPGIYKTRESIDIQATRRDSE